MSALQLGDIVFVNRLAYKHFGVYIGEGEVAHFAAPEGNETDAKKALILKTSLNGFLKGGRLCVLREKPDSEYKPFPPEEVVRRAKSQLGKAKGEYSLVMNNCEHFAYWCRYGEKESKQVDLIANLIVDVVEWFGDSKKFGALPKNTSAVTVECLKFAEIVSFFKAQERLKTLKENDNLVAVALKEMLDDGKTQILACIFDTKSEKIFSAENDCARWIANFVDDDLKNAFGDKPMVILQ